MPVRIRLARGGSKKRPFYSIVVAHGASPRDGRFIEKVGTYNPLLASDHPDRVVLKEERLRHWLGNGAQASDRVVRLLGARGIVPRPPIPSNPKKSAPKAKAQERLKAAQEAEAAARAEG